jgi:hypothetical protein
MAFCPFPACPPWKSRSILFSRIYPFPRKSGNSEFKRRPYFSRKAGVSGRGKTRTELKDWTTSDKLETGYNKTNSIKVTKSETNYTVFLNDTQVYQFPDDGSIAGSRIGYYVSVGTAAYEKFPNTPVDVRFKQK